MDPRSQSTREVFRKATGGSPIMSRTRLVRIFGELGLSERQLDGIIAASNAAVRNGDVDVAKIVDWCCGGADDIGSRRIDRLTKGLVDAEGKSIYEQILKGPALPSDLDLGASKMQEYRDAAKRIAEDHIAGACSAHSLIGDAHPKLLKTPEIATTDQVADATSIAARAVNAAISAAPKVKVVFAEDASMNDTARALLESCSDEEAIIQGAAVSVSMALDWLNTLPWLKKPVVPERSDGLLIHIGTPGKYAAMCIRSDLGRFDAPFTNGRLVVLCKGVCMCPIDGIEKQIYGVDEGTVLNAIVTALQAKGTCAWGHGASTKAGLMELAYGCPMPSGLPEPWVACSPDLGNSTSLGYLSEYVKFSNTLKLARPDLPVVNYYDTGLTVSVMMGAVANDGWSLLTDGDGIAMLRDASIGHIISKLNQIVGIAPLSKTTSVYNFFIGDGACRLNGGTELAFHIIEGLRTKSMITLFIFNNERWAIEDNIVGNVDDDIEEATEREHTLHNSTFYDLLAEHDRVCICEDEVELRTTLQHLTEKTAKYVAGEGPAGLSLVVVRGLKLDIPPILGDMEPVRQSPELAVLRSVLGQFASGCNHKVPLYGCSAFEYISFLHVFLEETPEGKKYQYCCGRTDIQAAHMCGFRQPEGRCVLFINDVYGVNSLGESLRMVLSGFGGKQLLVMIWHPSVVKAEDNFHLHRPPMVWPSLGPTLCQYYVRKESDAFFVDIEGPGPATQQLVSAIASGTPLIVANMMPW